MLLKDPLDPWIRALPNELLEFIFRRLDLVHLVLLGLTCSLFRQISIRLIDETYRNENRAFTLQALYLDFQDTGDTRTRSLFITEINRMNESCPLPSPQLIDLIFKGLLDGVELSGGAIYWNDYMREPLKLLFKYGRFTGSIFTEPKPASLIIPHLRKLDEVSVFKYVLLHPETAVDDLVEHKDCFEFKEPHYTTLILTRDISLYDDHSQDLRALDVCMLMKLARKDNMATALRHLARFKSQAVLLRMLRAFAAHGIDEGLFCGVLGILGHMAEENKQGLILIMASRGYSDRVYRALRGNAFIEEALSKPSTPTGFEVALMLEYDDSFVLSMPSPKNKQIFTIACLKKRSEAVLRHLFYMPSPALPLTMIFEILPGFTMVHQLQLHTPVSIYYEMYKKTLLPGVASMPNADALSDDFLCSFFIHLIQLGEFEPATIMIKSQWTLYDRPRTCRLLLETLKEQGKLDLWVEHFAQNSFGACQKDVESLSQHYSNL